MALRLPQPRQLPGIQLPTPRVQSRVGREVQSPTITGINAVSDILSKALQRRGELKQKARKSRAITDAINNPDKPLSEITRDPDLQIELLKERQSFQNQKLANEFRKLQIEKAKRPPRPKVESPTRTAVRQQIAIERQEMDSRGETGPTPTQKALVEKKKSANDIEALLQGLLGGQGAEQETQEIRVRDKKTGQTGSVPANEFDSKKFERL